jgi:hypothetical protein
MLLLSRPLTDPTLLCNTPRSVAYAPYSKTANTVLQDHCEPHCHSQEEQPLFEIAQHVDTGSYKLFRRPPKHLFPRSIRQDQLAAAYLPRLVDDGTKLYERTDISATNQSNKQRQSRVET